MEDNFNLSLCQTPDRFSDYLNLQGATTDRKNFCLIDEIQYLENPSNFLKLIHDHYPHIKLIITGSSSFEIRSKFKDALTGRKITFVVRPLSFFEYLRFRESGMEQHKKLLNLKTIIQDDSIADKYNLLTPKMLPLWEDFVIYGGYPKTALEKQASIRQQVLREIHNSYIRKDIKDIAKIENIYKFNNLVEFLALQTANLFRADEVCKEVAINIKTLEKYLFILENTFITSRLRPYHTNRQKELTKMPKLYFSDNGLLNAIIGDFRGIAQRPNRGELAENLCFSELAKSIGSFKRLYYWRTTNKQEVDFVLVMEQEKKIPIEVKYKNFVSSQ